MSNLSQNFQGKGNTFGELYAAVDAYICKAPELTEAVAILDYSKLSWGQDNSVFSEEDQIFCIVNTGGSEGVYVDCILKDREGNKRNLATYKTLVCGLDAYIKMGMIAGAFTKLAEEYMLVNFKEEKKE